MDGGAACGQNRFIREQMVAGGLAGDEQMHETDRVYQGIRV